jgi:DNA sulfur modification protein DndC
MGPLTMDARRAALARVLDVQARCNRLRPPGVEPVDILEAAEVARIHELIAANTWPRRWTGDEPAGDLPAGWDQSGAVQGLLLGEGFEGGEDPS